MSRDKLRLSGVYLIFNKITNRYYFGSTVESFKERWYAHKYTLKNGIHGNYRIQEDYDLYGPESFIYSVVFYSKDRKEIRETEQKLLDKFFGRKECYNLQPLVDMYSRPGKTYDVLRDYDNYLISPDGVLYEKITNAAKFSRENNLNKLQLVGLITGKVGNKSAVVMTHRGWSVLYFRQGKKIGRPSKTDDATKNKEVLDLREKGYSYRKIGKIVKLSRSSVQRIILESA